MLSEVMPEKCKHYGGESEPGYIICYKTGTEQKVLKATCTACPYYEEK